MRVFLLFVLLIINSLYAEDVKNDSSEVEQPVYIFTTEKEIPATDIKDQGKSGTCWAYGTISFLESEIIKKGKDPVDLSEMFIVRHTYPQKARKYVRLHGAATFGEGGQCHDVIDQIREHGIVPGTVYPDFTVEDKINHKEMSTLLDHMLEGILKRKGKFLTNKWLRAFNAVLDVYLGEVPESIEYNNKKYTPKEFAFDYLEIDPDDYIEVTSYTDHPFYEKYCLEVPDNWSYNCNYYNVKIDDLEKVVEHAIDNGYSICWDADVSEKYFTPDTLDIAVLPTEEMIDSIEDVWDGKIKDFIEEKDVTQELRQQTFDNFKTTDDHLMHLVGIAHDQRGVKYYKIKNSWGSDDKQFDGYYYISLPYFRLKTVALMVNKNALPKEIKRKLKLNFIGKLLH